MDVDARKDPCSRPTSDATLASPNITEREFRSFQEVNDHNVSATLVSDAVFSVRDGTTFGKATADCKVKRVAIPRAGGSRGAYKAKYVRVGGSRHRSINASCDCLRQSVRNKIERDASVAAAPSAIFAATEKTASAPVTLRQLL